MLVNSDPYDVLHLYEMFHSVRVSKVDKIGIKIQVYIFVHFYIVHEKKVYPNFITASSFSRINTGFLEFKKYIYIIHDVHDMHSNNVIV